MENLVSTAKMLLIERATEVFTARRTDLKPDEYINHYYNLGELIVRIDKYIYLSTVISDIENGEFDHIGLYSSDEDLASFMKDLYDSI